MENNYCSILRVIYGASYLIIVLAAKNKWNQVSYKYELNQKQKKASKQYDYQIDIFRFVDSDRDSGDSWVL